MKRLMLVIIMMVLYVPLVFGLPGIKQWTLVWDANQEADLAGYYLYWRAESETFTDTNRLDCGLVTEYSLSGLPSGVLLALTAYDTSENEGGFSIELPFNKDIIPPAAPGGLTIRVE